MTSLRTLKTSVGGAFQGAARQGGALCTGRAQNAGFGAPRSAESGLSTGTVRYYSERRLQLRKMSTPQGVLPEARKRTTCENDTETQPKTPSRANQGGSSIHSLKYPWKSIPPQEWGGVCSQGKFVSRLPRGAVVHIFCASHILQILYTGCPLKTPHFLVPEKTPLFRYTAVSESLRV